MNTEPPPHSEQFKNLLIECREQLAAERDKLESTYWKHTDALREQLAAEREKVQVLMDALSELHDDIAEYARINNLGGFDNHAMKKARAALGKVRERFPKSIKKDHFATSFDHDSAKR